MVVVRRRSLPVTHLCCVQPIGQTGQEGLDTFWVYGQSRLQPPGHKIIHTELELWSIWQQYWTTPCTFKTRSRFPSVVSSVTVVSGTTMLTSTTCTLRLMISSMTITAHLHFSLRLHPRFHWLNVRKKCFKLPSGLFQPF